MHDTKVKMKDGREFCSPLWKFRPWLGFLTLMDVEEKLYFIDMESAITKDERINAYEIGDCDELERARKYMRDARQFGWPAADTPVQDWETECQTKLSSD